MGVIFNTAAGGSNLKSKEVSGRREEGEREEGLGSPTALQAGLNAWPRLEPAKKQYTSIRSPNLNLTDPSVKFGRELI